MGQVYLSISGSIQLKSITDKISTSVVSMETTQLLKEETTFSDILLNENTILMYVNTSNFTIINLQSGIFCSKYKKILDYYHVCKLLNMTFIGKYKVYSLVPGKNPDFFPFKIQEIVFYFTINYLQYPIV